MKTLILIRHARAVKKKPSKSDFDRSLDRRGVRDADEAAAWLAESAGGGRVVCSPARRALETAEAVAEMLQIPCETDDRLIEASCEDLLEIVRAFDDCCGRVLLTGHNPGLSLFLRYLTDEPHADLPPGGIAVVELPVLSWRHVSSGCGGLTERFAPGSTGTGPDFGHPALSRIERFRNWRFAKAQRLEIVAVLIVALLLLLLLIPLVMKGTTDPAGIPQQGSSSP